MLYSWQQINTAEMLDLAVEFIKDLQKQVKVKLQLMKNIIFDSN